MSNSLAIAALTATLQSILEKGLQADADLANTKVTTQPLDKARDTNNPGNQLNLFLYQTLPNAAWRNMDLPGQVMPGETGLPPLALKLNYLITAYGSGDDAAQPFSHQVLGKAMSLLHDYAVLSPKDIKDRTTSFPRNDLDRQVERVRLTLLPMTLDELSKLWAGLQTQYRLSVAYEATVVLIESTRGSRTPLPVLTRGPQDRGVGSQADLTPPFPALDEVLPPGGQPSARLGDVLVLNGHHMDGTNAGDVEVIFNHPLWTTPLTVTPQGVPTATSLSVALPNQPDLWPSGFYTVAVRVVRPGESLPRTTNQLAFSLAPRITGVTQGPGPNPGEIVFTVTFSPKVGVDQQGTVIKLGQRVALLLGDREIVAAPPGTSATPTDTVAFVATGLPAGDYFARLRIDGVDSLLVDRSVTPPVFDQTQKVTVP